MPHMGRAKIIGVGQSLPESVVTNEHFASYLDTSDEWIRTRTGIAQRRHGGPTSELAVGASHHALARAGLDAADIDCLVLATCTPDQILPPTSAAVQDVLGLRCPAFDINVACTGFVYAVAIATSLTASHRRILVVGAEQLSRITDPLDRGTAILMADGAGAVVLERSAHAEHDVWADLGMDGSLGWALYADHGGTFVMKGSEVFRQAVRLCSDSVGRLLHEADCSVEDVAFLVPHQANQRIIEAIATRLGIPGDRCLSVVEDTGNTSAASIPLALDSAVEADRVHTGDLVVMAGFGAGMAWGSLLVRMG